MELIAFFFPYWNALANTSLDKKLTMQNEHWTVLEILKTTYWILEFKGMVIISYKQQQQ